MRAIICVLMLLSISACYGPHDRGSVHVDGVGGANWGDNASHRGGKGCPPGLAKQGRC